MTSFSFGAGTNTGNVREHNEDCYYFDASLGVWAVADGMGGHAGGEVASGIAKQTVKASVEQGEDIELSIQKAHFAILRAIKDGIGKKGMGTTIVAVQFDGENYKLAWVGDSRAYLWNGQKDIEPDKRISQISRDQSLVQMMVDAGAITPEQARYHPKKNIITQYVGQPELKKLRVDSVESTLVSGQKLILCSDGLSDEVGNDELVHIMQESSSKQASDQEIVDALIATAIKNGGHDNVTVIVVSAP